MFKIGDTVRISDCAYAKAHNTVGKITIIRDINFNPAYGYPFIVIIDNNKRAFKLDEIELVEKVPIESHLPDWF